MQPVVKCLLLVQSQDYNLSWVNCEMASFIHMKGTRKYFKDVHGPGMVMQVGCYMLHFLLTLI